MDGGNKDVAGVQRIRQCDLACIAKLGECFGNQLRKPEIQHFRLSAPCYKNIGGFDVSMDNPLSGGGVESIGNLDSEIEHFFDSERIPENMVAHRLAFDEFRGDKR